jgi:hypothetical protein
MIAQDLLAVGVLALSVWATLFVARRRSSGRDGSAGSHPVGRGVSMDFVNAGHRVSRSNRRILPPARTTCARAHLRKIATHQKPAPAAAQIHVAPVPGGPSYV